MHVSAKVGGHLVSKWSQTTDRDLQEWIVKQGQVPAQRGRQIPSGRPVSTSFSPNIVAIIRIYNNNTKDYFVLKIPYWKRTTNHPNQSR